MNNKDRKRQIAYEALMILGLLALLTFICRLMPEAVFGGCAPADPGRKNLCRSLR